MTQLLHSFRPRGAALAAFKCRERELLLAGPAGTGKSRGLLEKLHQMALRNPGMRGLIVRQTAISLTSSALVTWERDVVPEAFRDGSITWFGGSAREPAQYRYSNGSVIAVGGMDKPDKIMSTEYDVIYAQEATELTLDGWEKLLSRLRAGNVSFVQLMADCNPSHPKHFLKTRSENVDKAGKPTLNMLHSRHQDNPRYFDEAGNPTPQGAQYMAILDSLTGVRKLRLKDGLWAAAEGVIFELFDEALHVVDELPKGWESWPTDWTVDFGYTHPFVWQEWVTDPDGRGYLNQEIYHTGILVEDHAEHIKALTKDRPRPRRIICDHDAEDRATLERKLGMGTIAANKTVSEGLQATASRFKLAGDGKPRLYLRRNACASRDGQLVQAGKPASTIEEIPGYIWAPGKEAPVKERDDGSDAMRYYVAEVDLRGQTRVRDVRGLRR